MKRIAIIFGLLPLLGGCDQIKDRLGLPDPARIDAEGNAIGGACRHAGRGLEDCYRLNEEARKAAIYAGWKEMNEYMMKNNMEAVPPQVAAGGEGPTRHTAKEAATDATASGKGEKMAANEQGPQAEAKKKTAH